MADFILFMHGDAPAGGDDSAWPAYFAKLRAGGHFEGGSAIGDGVCIRKGGATPPIAAQLTGYLRVQAASLDEARRLVEGNPVYEAGGTIEIRELPRSGGG